MLMVEDSGSLASVDAVSALSVDALSNVDAQQLVSDMNTGGHTKLIRLDRNQKRENRFWRKQRAKEKKQRKLEEQLRKQEEEQRDIQNAPNGRSTAEAESTDEQESSASDEDTNGDSAEIVPAIDEDVESSAINGNEEGLTDSGYKAGRDAERNDEDGSENENLINLEGSDHDGATNTNGRADDGNNSLDDGEDSISQLSGHVSPADSNSSSATANQDKGNASESTAENSEIEDRIVSATNEEEYILENDAGSAEYQSSEDDDREKHDDVEKKERRSVGKIESSDEEDEKGSRVKSESDDDDVVIDDFRPFAVEEPANEIDDSKQEVRNNSHEQDGYETDDERERVTEPQHDDENFSGDRDVDEAKEQGADIVDELGGGDQSPSEWVGPRSVSPYMEQQRRNSDDVGRSTPLPDSLNDSTAGRDSVFEGSEPATNGLDADQQDADGSSSQRPTRPPSRVSLVYTYASGPKVLSHVELVPETEQKPPQTESDADVGDDKLNGKHVTFKDDVKAASSVRLRRRRPDVEDKMEEGLTHMKEMRKKNKERRKNRVSNSFRSSSTSGSMMNDKRLIKTGNIGTLVLHGQPQPRWNAYFGNARALSFSTPSGWGGPSLTDIIRYQEARRRDADLNNSGARRVGSTGRRRDERVRTPPAVAGRKHYRVQTEPYLEEIRDRRLETDAAVQTDPMMDRPSTPLFVPSKTGADVATQIYEGDLFDFELESAPILEVLVGKTVEQSLLEVMEEEELESLKQHQRQFQERRQAEVAEQQRLGERERRHVEEKERCMAQGRIALQQEQETEAKVAASALAQNYLADMVPAVFSNLRQKGFFFNGVERDIETTFMPWLRDAVEQELDKVLNGKEVLDELILDAVRKRRDELERRSSLTARLPPPPSPPVEPEPAGEASEAGEEDEDEDEADEEGVDEDEEEDAGEEATTDDEVPPPVRSDSATDKPAVGEEASNEQDEDDP